MATVNVLCSNSMRGMMEEIAPRFERASAHKVAVSYDPAKRMLDRIRGGERGDLVITGSAAIDALADEDIVSSSTRTVLARSSIGMAVRAGAPKPDISTVDAFKAAILNAQSVAYTIDGASGMHFAALIGPLGLAEAVKPKARRQPGGLVGELVARGEAEVAIQQISELEAVAGIDLVGPIPAEIQKTTIVSGAVFSHARAPEAAHALLEFLSTACAREVMRAKGLDPPAGEAGAS